VAHGPLTAKEAAHLGFLIADTFTASLARLTAQEQKAVKTAAFDLQLDPSVSGHRLHRLEGVKDRNFWSVRVNDDIRLIVHRTGQSLLLCYVDHHDRAYAWAERRKIERHPTTGAAQLVELRERVEEIEDRSPPTERLPEKPLLFAQVSEAALLSYGVPPEWIGAVRAATDDSLFDLAPHLPQEAAEALLNLATGGTPEVPEPAPADADPFSHPDAQRRFRVVADLEELQRALEAPWEKWAVFLHPSQRRIVERSHAGPTRVAGSAGTGKTIVALHRAAFLARRDPQARVLLTTFSKALANALETRLGHLVGNEPRVAERITVRPITGIGYELYTGAFGQPNIASPALVQALLREAAAKVEGQKFTARFLLAEWREVVDAWQLDSWEAYRDVSRLGRKTRIGGRQRELLWSIFERVRAGLRARNAVTWSEVFSRLARRLAENGRPPFDHAVVDEAQDLGVAEARFLAALGKAGPEALFFAGDLGQRIFQQPFSWRSLGINVRGRSYTLRINYRTSHQIRSRADRLLPSSLADVDGNTESRRGTVSAFDGPPPDVRIFESPAEEQAMVGRWIVARVEAGCQPHEVAVVVRTEGQLKRARAAVRAAGVAAAVLTDKVEATPGHVAISTMHLAKGLEFRATAVMACDDEILPLQDRIESVADEADLEEVYDTERHLLYVACTRARDHLLVTGVEPASEFLADLAGPQPARANR
jgi:plasmid maintenance system killer protein